MKMPRLNSLTITHNLIVFNGVRECFAFAKPLKANAHSKACQRVCLFQPATDRKSGRKKNTERTTRVTVAQLSIFPNNL